MQIHGTTGLPKERKLLGPRATTLNQNHQNDDSQHTRSNPNDRGRTHMKSSFSNRDF
jgi:hypothetical protein